MAQAIGQRLMAHPGAINEEEEQEAARELRQERMKPEKPEKAGEEPQSLRQQVMAAKQDEKKQGLVDKAKSAVFSPVRMGTSRALQWAWGVLIPSWGLSLIYINMHVFLRYVFPSMFCKLGEEWMPKMVKSEHSAQNVAGTMFGIVEIMGLLLLDILGLIIIGVAAGIIILILTWMGEPFWGKLWFIFKGIYELGWEGVIDLAKTFIN